MPRIEIDDQNWQSHVAPAKFGRGYEARKVAYGALPFAEPAETLPIIPRSEWSDRVRQKEKDRSRLSDIWRSEMNSVVFDQNGFSSCHAQSAVMAVMFLRAVMNEPYVLLSAGSVGGPVTNWKDQGAVIDEDLQVLVTRGAASQEYVPANAIKHSEWKPGAEANALLHRVAEWWDLGYKSEQGTTKMADRVTTCLLNNIPVPVGYNWWGHSVLLLDVVWDGTNLGFDALNSWGADYGEGGFFRLSGGRAIPDAAYAPRVTGGSHT